VRRPGRAAGPVGTGPAEARILEGVAVRRIAVSVQSRTCWQSCAQLGGPVVERHANKIADQSALEVLAYPKTSAVWDCAYRVIPARGPSGPEPVNSAEG
jgi:hypothetical protein